MLLRPAAELAAILAERGHLLGEITFLVGPGVAPAQAAPTLDEDPSMPQLAAALAARWGAPRQRVYKALLELERTLKA